MQDTQNGTEQTHIAGHQSDTYNSDFRTGYHFIIYEKKCSILIVLNIEILKLQLYQQQ